MANCASDLLHGGASDMMYTGAVVLPRVSSKVLGKVVG